jgi:hypothetical protein
MFLEKTFRVPDSFLACQDGKWLLSVANTWQHLFLIEGANSFHYICQSHGKKK